MNVWVAFFGALVRWALAAVFGGLVVKGIITDDMLKRLTGEGAETIVTGLLGLFVPLLWSFWQKIQQKIKLIIAKNEPPETPDHVIEKKTGEVPLPKKFSVAFNNEENL